MSSATLAAQPRWLAFESAASIAGCGDTHARVAGVLRWAGGIVDWTLDAIDGHFAPKRDPPAFGAGDRIPPRLP